MEVFLVIVIIALMLWLRSDISLQFSRLQESIKHMQNEIIKLRTEKTLPDTSRKTAPQPAPPVIITTPEKESAKEKGTDERPIVLAEELGIIENKLHELDSKDDKDEKTGEKFSLKEVQEESKPAAHIEANAAHGFQMPPLQSRPQKPGFFEQHPDMEKFIGENLINKIGIAILVLGIAFFVKYAIDKNWINEIGRTIIGLLAGGILIAIAHRLRKSYKGFSSVMIGGGLAVLYFTITIAFQQYHLFSQAEGFIIMAVITAFAVLLSIAYDRIELAVLAIIGGFATPFMVSTGEGNYKVLFTYLMILNVGMLVLAFRKKWNLVNIVCYVFTIIIYGSWLSTKCLGIVNAPYTGLLVFGALFYITFFLMNIIYNIKYRIKFQPLEISMLLSNTALFYAAGMNILHYINGGMYEGLFTALLAAFNFAFAFPLYKKQSADSNLIFLLIGIVLTFISLAAPVQLQGNYITLFWSAESVLLLWLWQKSQIRLICIASVIVFCLMLISLFMDWSQLYADHINKLDVVINQAFITSIVTVIAVFIIIRLLKKGSEDYFISKHFKREWYEKTLKTLWVTLLYGALGLELNYQLIEFADNYQCRNIVIACYNFTYVTGIIWFTKDSENILLINVKRMLAGACIVSWLFFFNNTIIAVRNGFLMHSLPHPFFFYLHLFLIALLIFLVLQLRKMSFRLSSQGNPGNDIVEWITVFLLVFIVSAELDHIVTVISFSKYNAIHDIIEQNHKIGWPVAWGVFSFILMQTGMRRNNRTLRIISLTLFAITILKLFIYDIRDVSEAGKIIAFIALGILLLVVSFMYQRLKKLILDDENRSKDNTNVSQGDI